MAEMFQTLALPIAASALAALACGSVGVLCSVRHRTYMAGAVSHSCFAGIGLARFLAATLGWAWATPTLGAFAAALAAGLFLALSPSARGREADGALSEMWAVGMALGLAFMAATPGYQSDLATWLFGSVLFVAAGDITAMVALDAALALLLAAFRRGILSAAFDERLAALRGEPVKRWNVATCVATAIAVVMLVRTVGIVLAVAMLALPAAAARPLARRLEGAMAIAAAFAFVSMLAGLCCSWWLDLPPSAPTVIVAMALRCSTALALRRRRRGA
ncbi:MAG: metal ABC transporter permease [Kiritimatiellae bacterium]|nr:metal ABC transporter permease [Kiritimatiellia bacterium]